MDSEILKPQLEAVAGLAARADALNDNYATAQLELAGTNFEPVVEECLAEEQQSVWLELVEKGRQLPFAELGQKMLAAADEAEALQDSIAAKLAIAVKLAPSRQEKLSRIAEEQLAVAAEQRLAPLDGLFKAAAGAWPVPQAFDYRAALEAREALPEEADDKEIETIEDIIPVDLIEQERNENIRARVEYAKDNPETTDYIHAYLIEKAGKTVTVDELVQFVYTPEQIARLMSTQPRYLRSRITGLIGKEHGEKLRAEMLAEGFTLQYGWRIRSRLNPATGHREKDNRKRIYRAAPTETIDTYGAADHLGTPADSIVDQWEKGSVPEIDDLQAVGAKVAPAADLSILESALHTVMPAHTFEVRLADDEDVPPMNRAERRAAGMRGRSVTVIDQILQRQGVGSRLSLVE